MNRTAAAGPDAAVIWSERFLDYRWISSHPMNPCRLALTMSLSRSLGVLDGIDPTAPVPAADDLLHRVHTSAYVDAVRAAGARVPAMPAAVLERVFGLGGDDNPVYPGMHEASALLVGGSVAAAQAVATGAVRRAVNIGGGMHHAMRGHASGFCVYNDVAVAIRFLLDHGFDRIAYLDIDAHHGDGVQQEFVADPRVLTVSLHQHPATLWPGTGSSQEVGEGEGEGSAVNLPLMPGTPDRLWLRAFHAVVPSALEHFRPQILVSQCGVDTHRLDPLTDLSLTVDGQRAAFLAMRDLADRYCDGRWVAVGGGGYGVVDVVPRVWTHLIAAVLDRDLDPQTPVDPQWCAAASDRAAGVDAAYARQPVPVMTDGGDVDHVPWDGDSGQEPPAGISESAQRSTDAAILATRRAVFPLYGLDPEDPRD
ncbi:acetoin utilization protein AcuC [Williamsia sterculiae]|uniref:Acetoin utilization protein AcuC n=1 Tax=Williamsia sterculiae TaxID=1344003 RepID=A0A1N7EF05_9NOCA|nr:acetoin utilization protein AcuC [Williamsia sterculiae]SIR86558.1 acetoin utilization protein AcuC [Williamsia sterculiae]